MIILVTRDLFFASKVTGTAALLGLNAAMASDQKAIERLLADHAVTGLILDLGVAISPDDVLKLTPMEMRSRTIAFGPHVDTQALMAAEQAGFAAVLPRSRFSAELPRWLRELSASRSKEPRTK